MTAMPLFILCSLLADGAGDAVPAGVKHWAFSPLAPVEPPVVNDATWCRTPIDRFILARLEAVGIAPNLAADRRTLARRVSMTVTGLPALSEEIAAFEHDAAPDAYEHLVDRLLGSPRLGERWARHWLDLARFAESHGFEHDYDRPNAYHYRDFLIRAFNADLPFDQFASWQLAGDEIAPENPLALMATGFLGAGVHNTQITKNQVEKERYDELDDMLATTGTTFLGLTLGCARCHDHKFDPIPTQDYYRLLATFTTTVRSDLEVDMDPEGHRLALQAWEAEHAPLVEQLARFDRDELPRHFEAWLQGPALQEPDVDWALLDIGEAKSLLGTTFRSLGDGSLLAEGKNPDHDTHVYKARLQNGRVAALRLEALSHASLVKGGPGRAGNGNFALTELKVTASQLDGSATTELQLARPRATFEQQGLAAAGAIDGDANTAWAIDPQFGKNHAVAFEVNPPLRFEAGAILELTLKFANNTGHGIARPRLSVSASEAAPALEGTSRPERVASTLALLRQGKRELQEEDRAALEAWHRSIAPERLKLLQRLEAHLAGKPKPRLQKILVASEGVPAIRLHTQGDDFFPETHFLERGDPGRKQGVAEQGFLQSLARGSKADSVIEARWKFTPPEGAKTSYRRSSLARWLTDVESGAGGLLARVVVNRLWQHHFGRGIVATASDFGTQGERPTHPELLDWLAYELIRGGWRLKPIHRLIVTSAVYLESSQHDEDRAARDVDARLGWRRVPHRLEAEAIRDAMLHVSGRLDLRLHGPGTLDANHQRRGLYFTIKRSALIPMLVLFDAPDALQPIAERPTTTVAPQALHLMNSAFVRDCALALARQALARSEPGSHAQTVDATWRLTLGRAPDTEEQDDARQFLARQEASHQSVNPGEARALAARDLAQVLFALSEFLEVE